MWLEKKSYSGAQALFNLLSVNAPSEWPEDELYEQMKKGSFYLKRIPQTKASSLAIDPEISTTPPGDPPTLNPLAYNTLPTTVPLLTTLTGMNQPEPNNACQMTGVLLMLGVG
ncbi:hypothetical protein K3495_g9839 [Podosphaera aphanis]|nr:hypothetical protein K3495_g9839 [Podosphaera aphanis]